MSSLIPGSFKLKIMPDEKSLDVLALTSYKQQPSLAGLSKKGTHQRLLCSLEIPLLFEKVLY
jgi:hypothetical protein